MKVGIIGAGRVGASAAFSMLHQLELDEIVLIDIDENLVKGEALDLTHAAHALGKSTKVSGGLDYSQLAGADVIVITAGKARTPDMTRADLLHINVKIINSIVTNITKHNKDCILLQVSNPMDVLTYIDYKVSNFPKERVIGMGGVLDTARLNSLGYSGIVLGEHGEVKVPVTTGEYDSIMEQLKEVNMNVIKLKSATVHGPGASIARMVKAILNDTKEKLPVSCILNGEYGLTDVAIGVEAVLGRKGIEEIVETELTPEQAERFQASAKVIKESIEEAMKSL